MSSRRENINGANILFRSHFLGNILCALAPVCSLFLCFKKVIFMKKFLAVSMTVLMILLSFFSVTAFAVGDEYMVFTLNGDGTGYIIESCDSSMAGDVAVPAEYDGLPVTAIGDSAFRDCVGITSVELPDSVTVIGNYSFYECSGLQKVVLGKNTIFVGEEAFYNCSSLESINLPDTITDIGDNAFYNCDGLVNVKLPENLTVIRESLFMNCDGLRFVSIPDAVTEIKHTAFYRCKALEEITIPHSVVKLGNGVFYECLSLKRVEFGGSFEEIGTSCFGRCSGLQTVFFNTFCIENLSDYLDFGLSVSVTPHSAMFLGTGDAITVSPQYFESFTFTCIVKNDANGDGVCDVLDCAWMALVINGHRSPSDIELLAADCNGDEVLTVDDYQNIINTALQQ